MFSVPLPSQGGPVGLLQTVLGWGSTVRFGQLIPSKVSRELHTVAEPPIFTLGK